MNITFLLQHLISGMPIKRCMVCSSNGSHSAVVFKSTLPKHQRDKPQYCLWICESLCSTATALYYSTSFQYFTYILFGGGKLPPLLFIQCFELRSFIFLFFFPSRNQCWKSNGLGNSLCEDWFCPRCRLHFYLISFSLSTTNFRAWISMQLSTWVYFQLLFFLLRHFFLLWFRYQVSPQKLRWETMQGSLAVKWVMRDLI